MRIRARSSTITGAKSLSPLTYLRGLGLQLRSAAAFENCNVSIYITFLTKKRLTSGQAISNLPEEYGNSSFILYDDIKSNQTFCSGKISLLRCG
jgi:hypothetical protein